MSALRLVVDRAISALLGALMALLVVLVCWQVVTRFLLRNPSSVTEEAARFLLIWLGLVGGAYALGQRQHLAIDVFTERSPRFRTIGRLVSALACLFFGLGVMSVGGGRLVLLTLDLGQTSAALGWRLGYVYLALPLAGLLLGFYTLANLLDERGG